MVLPELPLVVRALRGLGSLLRLRVNLPQRKIAEHQLHLAVVGGHQALEHRLHAAAIRTLEVGKLDEGNGRVLRPHERVVIGMHVGARRRQGKTHGVGCPQLARQRIAAPQFGLSLQMHGDAAFQLLERTRHPFHVGVVEIPDLLRAYRLHFGKDFDALEILDAHAACLRLQGNEAFGNKAVQLGLHGLVTLHVHLQELAAHGIGQDLRGNRLIVNRRHHLGQVGCLRRRAQRHEQHRAGEQSQTADWDAEKA